MRRTRKLTATDVIEAVIWSMCVLLFILGLFACRTSPTDGIEKAIDGSQKVMAVLDVYTTKAARAHKDGTAAAVEVCRATVGPDSTPAEREACLHQFLLAPDDIAELEALLRDTGAVYDGLVDLLPKLQSIVRFIEGAEEAQRQHKELQ